MKYTLQLSKPRKWADTYVGTFPGRDLRERPEDQAGNVKSKGTEHAKQA